MLTRADEHGVVAHSTRHRDRLADQPLPLGQRVAEEQLGGERREQARALDGVTFANRVERRAHRLDALLVDEASCAEEAPARREHRSDLGVGVTGRVRQRQPHVSSVSR